MGNEKLQGDQSTEHIRILEDTISQLEQKLRESEAALSDMANILSLYTGILEHNLAGVYVINNDRFSYVDQSFADIFGYATPGEVVGKSGFIELVTPEYRDLVVEHDQKCSIGEIKAFRYECMGSRKDGSRVVVEVLGSSTLIKGKHSVNGFVLDATDYKRVSTLAFFNSITGLPNRALFADRLKQAIILGRRNNGNFALMFIHLDGLKKVNDGLGQMACDHVLRESAQRLMKLLRNSDTVARVGGDEFAAILTGAAGHNISAQMAISISESLEVPIYFSGHTIGVSASIGISLFPQDGGEIDILIRSSDTAMREAQKGGKCAYLFAS